MNLDWKDALSALSLNGNIPAPNPEEEENPESPQSETCRDILHVIMERKGRKGKTATIIEGFTCTDAQLTDIARWLKQTIGTGGSARGGEILLQGDWQQRARELLRKRGYSVKG